MWDAHNWDPNGLYGKEKLTYEEMYVLMLVKGTQSWVKRSPNKRDIMTAIGMDEGKYLAYIDKLRAMGLISAKGWRVDPNFEFPPQPPGWFWKIGDLFAGGIIRVFRTYMKDTLEMFSSWRYFPYLLKVRDDSYEELGILQGDYIAVLRWTPPIGTLVLVYDQDENVHITHMHESFPPGIVLGELRGVLRIEK